MQPGQTYAHYSIIAKIGAGGMGEVYRAHDTKLRRDVALKILPQHVATEGERLARFDREAKLLASLNHPNIATVYGFHESGGVHFLAMELVEGEDLSKRLSRGHLAVRDALEIAGQIAEAVGAAHDAGVIHRDLKPGNVVINNDGRVKVLDFGLAKALDPAASSGSANPSMSPTVTSAGTMAGTILGTAAYMSPEQARGHAVGRRADIWAFGAVLYELLTGRRPFGGKTISDTLAAVLKEEPDWSALPTDTPAAVTQMLKRCLTKDRKRRLRHIGDAWLVLDDPGDEPVSVTRGGIPAWAWAVAVLGIAAAWFVGSQFGGTDKQISDLPHRQYSISLPGLSATDESNPVISPDGKRLVYRIKNQLMIRDLGSLDDRPVTGGEGGNAPFWSTDGAWLAFGRDSRLWKVPAVGGPPVMLCHLPGEGRLIGGAWSDLGRIAISILRDSIYLVPEAGGPSTVFLEPDPEIGSDFQNLLFLPDSETLLTTPHPIRDSFVAGTNMGKVLAVRNGEATVVLGGDEENFHAHSIAWSTSGHLLYNQAFHNVGIWAVPFSTDRLVPTGEPFLVAANAGSPSLSDDGTLVFFPDAPDPSYWLHWADRTGKLLERVGKPALALRAPALAPDGTRVAYSANPDDGKEPEIYVQSLDGGLPIRLTFEENYSADPSWSADSRQLVYTASNQVSIKPADGTGETTSLFQGYMPSMTPDGQNILYHDSEMGEKTSDIMLRPVDENGEPTTLLAGPGDELGRLSPEGDYLAYQSNETGQNELYLTRYPECEGKWQLSTNGGQEMRWVPGGNELIYRDLHNSLISVKIGRQKGLHIAEPVQLLNGEEHSIDLSRGFAISPDGSKLLLARRFEGADPTLVIVQNWRAGHESGEIK